MASRSVAIVALFYFFHVCSATDGIDYGTCMANVNETIGKYSDEYNLYIERKYNWIYEVALSYKDSLPQLPGYDPDNPELCDEIDYTYEVFKGCGGTFIDEGTYNPDFDYFSSVEDICNWLVINGSEFYYETSMNKIVTANCDYNAGLASYNYQHGLCWKDRIGTE